MAASSEISPILPAQRLILQHYEARSLIKIDLTADKSLEISGIDHQAPTITAPSKLDSEIRPIMVTMAPSSSSPSPSSILTTALAPEAAMSISPIVNLKRLHGWITWQLIRMFAKGGETVLDLACGKGGDLRKWEKAKALHYVGVDMVAGLLEAAHRRYLSSACRFTARFVCADAYSGNLLKEVVGGEGGGFDLVSCQFALHYAWSCEERARGAMRNVAASLKPGGFFIGTVPDADAIVEKLRMAATLAEPGYDEIDCRIEDDDNFSWGNEEEEDGAERDASSGMMSTSESGAAMPCGGPGAAADPDIMVGNSVYHITFTSENYKRALGLGLCSSEPEGEFGIQYDFFLADAVHECPEWLVPLASLRRLGRELGLDLVFATNFHRFFGEHLHHIPHHSTPDEWDCASIYLTFAFQKHKAS